MARIDASAPLSPPVHVVAGAGAGAGAGSQQGHLPGERERAYCGRPAALCRRRGWRAFPLRPARAVSGLVSQAGRSRLRPARPCPTALAPPLPMAPLYGHPSLPSRAPRQSSADLANPYPGTGAARSRVGVVAAMPVAAEWCAMAKSGCVSRPHSPCAVVPLAPCRPRCAPFGRAEDPATQRSNAPTGEQCRGRIPQA